MILGQPIHRIMLYSAPINMQKSFDGLVGLVKDELGEDPLSGMLFLFFNRRRNYLKGIFWHRTGYVVVAKKLERGKYYFQESVVAQELDYRVFALLLDGVKLGIV